MTSLNIEIEKVSVTAKPRKLKAGWQEIFMGSAYYYEGMSGLFEPQWHVISTYDHEIRNWIFDKSNNLWHMDEGNFMKIYLHPSLYHLFVLKWTQ